MIAEVDEGLHMILQEVMEERLEDAGYRGVTDWPVDADPSSKRC